MTDYIIHGPEQSESVNTTRKIVRTSSSKSSDVEKCAVLATVREEMDD